jgi:hypothetical protein
MKIGLKEDGSWARLTFTMRLSPIVDAVLAAHAWSPEVVSSLRALSAEASSLAADVVPIAGDDELSRAFNACLLSGDALANRQKKWEDLTYFDAEMYFYARLLDAVRYSVDKIDPFRPTKAAAIKECPAQITPLWSMVSPACGTWSAATFAVCLHGALWGNRADLSQESFLVDLSSGGAQNHFVLRDDTDALFRVLSASTAADLNVNLAPASNPASARAAVHLVLDNAGLELASDLVLAAYLTSVGFKVTLHCKHSPMFVSDATESDVHEQMETHPASDLLRAALASGSLAVVPCIAW